ncbi:citrate lyase holo-[acyl-carrier protein] synthase [Clostridium sp. Marseille-P2415]|uniref:citrate lyase holo-[acyl-carrier protein] synthase n=1 Tax=Clostridium sp. Marseille-P2415 TaxID=1805471 RepID=UPI000988567A|nr:citrate lyase holo-[acyl-carrier protein] synthase [Clostridium sp. Marseille-P2415]
MEENVTLEEMLYFREEKVRMQEELRKKHEGVTIVALGMNVPGPRKTSPAILLAFTEGGEALDRLFSGNGLHVTEEAVIKEKAGYLKLYAVKSLDHLFVKKITVRLEETHPLGRLFDIDVYDGAGRGISREELGASVRKCLICEKDAKICGRSRNHTVEELYCRVENIIDSWLKEGGG